MSVTKNFRCDTCSYEFETKQVISQPNPKCPKCDNFTSWLPKLNVNPPQISYALRVICDGFSDKIHEQRIV